MKIDRKRNKLSPRQIIRNARKAKAVTVNAISYGALAG